MKKLSIPQVAVFVLALVFALPVFADTIADYYYFQYGFSAGSGDELTVSDSGDVNTSGDLEVTGVTGVDEFTEGGGAFNVATTAATRTLTAAELLTSNVINITPSGTSSSAQAALTLTLPATNTITAMLASAGDARTWYIFDQHTAVGTTTTIAAGTGIDLEIATSSPNAPDRTIRGGASAMLQLIRESDTDIRALMTEFNEGD